MVISARPLPSLNMWCVHDVHSLEEQRPEAAVILGRSLQYVQVQIATSAKFVKNLGEERFATYPDSFQKRCARQSRIETAPF